MSNWIRGIYNAAANFNMRNALQYSHCWSVDRNNKHMREECNESDKSNVTDKSDKSANFDCTCDRKCACSRATEDRSVIIGNDVIPTPDDYIERDYNEYVEYTASACREDISTWVRVSDEPRDFKQTDADSTDAVDRCNGLPTGDTI